MTYRCKFLKKWGVLCISLSLIIIFFQGLFFEIEMPPVLGEKSSSVKFILLTAVLIFTVVPLIEEAMFRGFLFKKKSLIILSTIFAAIYILYKHLNLFHFGFFILHLICLAVWLSKGRPKNIFFKILLVVNACFFQSLHQNLSDFDYFIIYPLFILGLGFVFIVQFLFLNYGFLKAVLFHSFWNLMVVIIGLSDLQFPSGKVNEIENKKIKISWKEAALFDRKTIRYDDFEFDFKTYLIRDLFPQHNDSVSTNIKNDFYQTKIDQRYDLNIKVKDSTFIQSEKFLPEVYHLLEKNGLIIEINN